MKNQGPGGACAGPCAGLCAGVCAGACAGACASACAGAGGGGRKQLWGRGIQHLRQLEMILRNLYLENHNCQQDH